MLFRFFRHNGGATGRHPLRKQLGKQPKRLKRVDRHPSPSCIDYIQQHDSNFLKMDIQQVRNQPLEGGLPLRDIRLDRPGSSYLCVSVCLLSLGAVELCAS